MRVAASADQIRRWWRRWPQANVGVVTGAVSGLVVLDVDPRHGGDDSLADLEAVHGPLPPSVESLTGGGGRHLYFCHPGTTVLCRSIAPGLDVKGDGGVVICPPSVHTSGHAYAWKVGCAPDEIPVADLPGWLSAMARGATLRQPGADGERREVVVRTDIERAEFASLWARVGIELRPGDHNYLCPFHPDHHPSLHIDAEGCRFYCFGCGLGGGSGRLRRLVGASPRPARESEAAATGVPGPGRPTTLPGTTEVRVVGESAYQGALLELTGGRRYGGVHTERVAFLVPEPGNPADPDAISVQIGGRTVGYLSRLDSARLRSAVAVAIGRSGEASCMATIVGGWERGHGDIGLFGVRLHLGIPDIPAEVSDNHTE